MEIFDAERDVDSKVEPDDYSVLEFEVLNNDYDILMNLLTAAEKFERQGVQHILFHNNYTIKASNGQEINVTTLDQALVALSRGIPDHLGELKAA